MAGRGLEVWKMQEGSCDYAILESTGCFSNFNLRHHRRYFHPVFCILRLLRGVLRFVNGGEKNLEKKIGRNGRKDLMKAHQ